MVESVTYEAMGGQSALVASFDEASAHPAPEHGGRSQLPQYE